MLSWVANNLTGGCQLYTLYSYLIEETGTDNSVCSSHIIIIITLKSRVNKKYYAKQLGLTGVLKIHPVGLMKHSLTTSGSNKINKGSSIIGIKF